MLIFFDVFALAGIACAFGNPARQQPSVPVLTSTSTSTSTLTSTSTSVSTGGAC
jgi:hypothetical protein